MQKELNAGSARESERVKELKELFEIKNKDL